MTIKLSKPNKETPKYGDTAGKIYKLSKGKNFSLQQKIEIMKKYLDETQGCIDSGTVYEGNPIGYWAIQIRSQVKNNRIDLKKEQLETLGKLGILERGIDSTIDEKIDALIEWKKNYPDIIIEGKKGELISEKTIEKLKALAQTGNIEFSELLEKYEKIRSYNRYVRARAAIGKLKKEQWDRCKEGNLRGKFGFPIEIEKLADKLKIDVKQAADIIDRFGTVANFIQMYIAGKLSTEDTVLYNKNMINNLIDIDYSPLTPNYSRLVSACFDESFVYEHEFSMFSSNGLEKALKTLTEQEEKVLRLRFGLDDNVRTFEEAGKELQLSRERIRQIAKKSIRKLKHPSRLKLFKPITIKELKESEYISDEEIEALTNLENDILGSNLIFIHDSADDLSFDKEKFGLIRRVRKNIELREESAKVKASEGKAEKETTKRVSPEETPESIGNINISEMNLSVRSYGCLSRAGIKTIADLCALAQEDLENIRRFGRKTSIEIISKLETEYGVVFDEKAESGGASKSEKTKKVYTESEIEEIKAKKIELEATLDGLEKQVREARSLLNEYERIIGDSKSPDFKDE